MLKRKQHWATQAFHEFLLARANTSFVWGTADCCTFCADGILAMTGVDIDADFRGRYTDEASAMSVIAKATGISNPTVADGAAYCADKYQLPEWTYPLMAQRGDLVLVEDAGRLIAGLVHLSGRHIVAAGTDGLKKILITKTNIKRAWRV